MYFYDINRKVFLVEGIHEIPSDSIPVREKDFYFLINGRASDKEIILMNNNLTLTPPKPSHLHYWNGTEWILDETQKAEFKRAMQETMRAKIVAKRDEMLNGGVFIPEFGKTVDTDATALSNYVQMKADFDLNGTDNDYTLIFSDFSFKAINFDEFKILWNAVKKHKERCYENATMHITLMLQEENPEDYDFSEFWQG